MTRRLITQKDVRNNCDLGIIIPKICYQDSYITNSLGILIERLVSIVTTLTPISHNAKMD